MGAGSVFKRHAASAGAHLCWVRWLDHPRTVHGVPVQYRPWMASSSYHIVPALVRGSYSTGVRWPLSFRPGESPSGKPVGQFFGNQAWLPVVEDGTATNVLT